MEYLGEFKDERKYLANNAIPQFPEAIEIGLLQNELEDFINVAEKTGLHVFSKSDRYTISDQEGRNFILKKIADSSHKRVQFS